jgi:hypothetical protein
METTKLTVRLPKEELEFAKQYARDHGITVTALIDRYLSRLQSEPPGPVHPDVQRFSGLVPSGVSARELYLLHLDSKHR